MVTKIKNLFSKLMDPENKKAISYFFIISFLIIFIQLIIFLLKVYSEFKIPTVQTKAKLELIKFSKAETLEKRNFIFKKALKSRIYLWPKKGILINKAGDNLKEQMDKTLDKLFKEEYRNIPSFEKKFLFNKTVVHISNDLRKKIRDNFFLSNKLIEEKTHLSTQETSLISHHYTGTSRYSWHGYDKTLLYFLDKKSNGEYRLFFSSLSDVADKTNFIEATFIFLFILILSNFLLSYFNHYINLKKQIQANKKISSLYKQTEQKNSELKALSAKLAKFLDPQVYKSIFSGEKEIKIETYRKMLTVFFVDIKDFTELTENLEPEPLTKLLNDYINEMSKIANKYGGTVDKFMGDGILIFFGDPNTKGQKHDALNCVLMGLEMRDEISVLQKKWYNQGIPRLLKIRMGIHTGYCTVGNFGSENRLDYTIIGGTVNISGRLESMAELDQILISHTTYALINNDVDCDEKGIIKVRGIAYPIKTYLVKKPFSLEDKNKLKSHFSKKSPGFSLTLNLNDVNKKEVEDYLKGLLEKLK